MQSVQTFEIEVASIHHVEGSRLGQQFVEDVDVVQFPIGDVDEVQETRKGLGGLVQVWETLQLPFGEN